MKPCSRCGGWTAIDRELYPELYCVNCGHRVNKPLLGARPIPAPSYRAGVIPVRKGQSFSDRKGMKLS